MKKYLRFCLRPGLAIATILLTFFVVFSEPYSAHFFNDSDEYQLPATKDSQPRPYCVYLFYRDLEGFKFFQSPNPPSEKKRLYLSVRNPGKSEFPIFLRLRDIRV